ncbi:MAG: ABC transporter ATP-binding protein [Alphaproteobacteria bacterium]|nr:ABC transporter ATP-binding protein [Alphaproteobacteria bacterium]
MLIDVRDLSVRFGGRAVVDGVSLGLLPGERMAIVGESGSGKSTLARALLGLVAHPGQVGAGRLVIDGTEMSRAKQSDWRKIRGRIVGLMLQDPRYSLHPTMTIGQQIGEVANRPIGDCLAEVGLSPDIAQRYPHQMSGGQGQRAYLAMTLAQRPKLLIADEPTSALDPPMAAQMMALLDERMTAQGMGLLLITHDIELAMQACPRLLVMQDGRIVEELAQGQTPVHPFTQRLIRSIPRLPC